MGKGKSPGPEELKFVYEMIADGYSDKDILAKFNGDKLKAEAFMDAYFLTEERKIKQTEQLFDPNGPVMKQMNREFEEAIKEESTPVWKRIVNKIRK